MPKIAVVTGSRDWPAYGDIAYELKQFDPDLIVHGNCKSGADAMADEYASHYVIKAKHFNADWKMHGRAAGPLRNNKMIVWAKDMKDHGHHVKVFAFRLNESRGTTDCIRKARMHGLDVLIRDMVSPNNV